MEPSNPIIAASNKGYRVDEQGSVFNKFGGRVNIYSNGEGYMYFSVRLAEHRRRKNIKVARLQAFQKFGDAMFAPGIVVRHLDGNPGNNSASNIEIGTASQNQMDIPKEVRMASALKATSCRPVQHDHAKVRAFALEHGYKAACAEFGISSLGTISFIVNKSIEAKSLTAQAA